ASPPFLALVEAAHTAEADPLRQVRHLVDHDLRLGLPHRALEPLRVERVTDDCRRTVFAQPTGALFQTGQGDHLMTCRDEARDKRAADRPSRAGEEDLHRSGSWRRRSQATHPRMPAPTARPTKSAGPSHSGLAFAMSE